MKHNEDYIRDISEIRSIMERSTKFLSLSGWAGIMAGAYALIGAYMAYYVFHFRPDDVIGGSFQYSSSGLVKVVATAVAVLLLSFGTAIYFSNKRAMARNERLWNPVSKRLMLSVAAPLFTGGLLILMLAAKGLTGLMAPLTLLFYGLSLFVASKYTYEDIKVLGLVHIILGLAGCWFISYGMLFWALGFGVAHIIYGVYMHFKYE